MKTKSVQHEALQSNTSEELTYDEVSVVRELCEDEENVNEENAGGARRGCRREIGMQSMWKRLPAKKGLRKFAI